MIYSIIALIFFMGLIVTYILYQADLFVAEWRTNVVIIAGVICALGYAGFLITSTCLSNSAEAEIDNFNTEIHIAMNNLINAEPDSKEYWLCYEKCKEINDKITEYKEKGKDFTSKYSLANVTDRLHYIELKGE